MSFKWVTVKGSDGQRSYKVSAGGDKHYVYDGSGSSLGSASSLEDAISIIKSKYGSKVWSVEIGTEQSGCFPASALILTPSGPRSIASIQPGEVVTSYKKDTSTTCLAIVTARLDHSPSVIWQIQTADQATPLRSTAIHAYLTSRGWIQACQLLPGDELLGAGPSGQHTTTVTTVTETNTMETVHNLITTGEHNFIADGFVVHNFTYLRVPRTWWHRVFIDPMWDRELQEAGLKAPKFPRLGIMSSGN